MNRIAGTILLFGVTGCAQPTLPDGGLRVCTDVSQCLTDEDCVGGLCVAATHGDADVAGRQRSAIARLLTESVRFTNVGRNDIQTRAIRLRNVGEESLVVERLDIVGASGRLQVSPQPDSFTVAIPPAGELTFTASFVGSDGVSFAAAFVLHTNDRLAPRLSVPAVVEYTGAPELVVTREAFGQHAESIDGMRIDLGPVPEGIGRAQSFWIKNLGVGGMYAVLQAPVIEGEGAAVFSVEIEPAADADGVHRLARFAAYCADSFDCDIGASCTGQVCWQGGDVVDALRLTIHATGIAGVERTARLRLPYASPSGGGGRTVQLDLVAAGVVPGPFAEPSTVDFGLVSVGYPQSRIVRLVNATAADMLVAAVDLTGPGALPPNPPVTANLFGSPPPFDLAPGAERLIRVDFVATSSRLGASSALLEIGTPTPMIVAVDGTARVGPSLLTDPLIEIDGGSVHVGGSADTVLTLANVGGAGADALIITGLAASVSAGAGDILVLPAGAPPPILPGAVATVTVQCQPLARGELRGRVEILSDAPDNPVRTLVVRCDGIDPEIELSYRSRDSGVPVGQLTLVADHDCRAGTYPAPCSDFGESYLGENTSLDLSIENHGADPLTLTSVVVQPTGQFSSSPIVLPSVVPPGEAIELTLTYSGTGVAGLTTASLRIEHDDRDAAAIDLALVVTEADCVGGERACTAIAPCVAEGTIAACCRAATDPAACGAACLECPLYTHSTPSCDGTACAYSCQAGWHDFDGQPGCEYECFVTSGGIEQCDGVDNDCDGFIDNGLSLADGPAADVEAPAVCTPGSSAGLLGLFDEGDLGSLTIGGVGGGAGALLTVVQMPGRIYAGGNDPSGDVDWLRLLFGESNACAGVGFRLEASVLSPAGTPLELCGNLNTPSGGPLPNVACAENAGTPVFSGCVDDGGVLRFDWAEICGVADDRVLDLRLRALTGATGSAAASCEVYTLIVSGAVLY